MAEALATLAAPLLLADPFALWMLAWGLIAARLVWRFW